LVVTLTRGNTLSRGTDSASCHIKDLTHGQKKFQKRIQKI